MFQILLPFFDEIILMTLGKLDPKERRILTHRKMHWKLIPLTDGQKTTGKDNNERKTENNNERKIEDNEKKAEE